MQTSWTWRWNKKGDAEVSQWTLTSKVTTNRRYQFMWVWSFSPIRLQDPLNCNVWRRDMDVKLQASFSRDLKWKNKTYLRGSNLFWALIFSLLYNVSCITSSDCEMVNWLQLTHIKCRRVFKLNKITRNTSLRWDLINDCPFFNGNIL